METGLVFPANSNPEKSKRTLPDGARPYMFKPGQSGNPNGRPKKITSALDRAVNRHIAKRLAYAIIGEATSGSVSAFEAIRETIEGPLPRPVQVAGDGGGPVQFQLSILHMGLEPPSK